MFPKLEFSGVNPKNVQQIIKAALKYRVKLQENGFIIKGINGRFQNNQWLNNPKIALRTRDSASKNHNLSKPQKAKTAKALIAILYTIGQIDGCMHSCDIVYIDKGGKRESIASRHGPEHSNYMSNLINTINQPGLIEELESQIRMPIPENLNELEKEILDIGLEESIISIQELNVLKKKYDCDELFIDETLTDLLERKDLGSRRIPKLALDDISALKYMRDTKQLQEIISSLNEDKKRLAEEIENAGIESKKSKDELEKMQSKIDAIMNRTLIQRIFNKTPNESRKNDS